MMCNKIESMNINQLRKFTVVTYPIPGLPMLFSLLMLLLMLPFENYKD